MSLILQIDSDYIEAYKNKDELTVSVLRLLKTALKNLSIEKKTELTNQDAITVITKEIKQRREASIEYEKGGRQDLAGKEKDEIVILSKYLPEQMGEDEIRTIVSETLSVKSYTKEQTGRAIGEVMSKVKGRADGGLVARLVNEYLAGN
ncbi:MAG: GatB/YqeY domain-containing protein [Patescibacteria group bacterium]